MSKQPSAPLRPREGLKLHITKDIFTSLSHKVPLAQGRKGLLARDRAGPIFQTNGIGLRIHAFRNLTVPRFRAQLCNHGIQKWTSIIAPHCRILRRQFNPILVPHFLPIPLLLGFWRLEK